MNQACREETHEWAEWAYQPGQCTQVRQCRHCPAQEEREMPCEWGEVQWHPDNTYSQTCKRCQKTIDVSEEMWEKVAHWRALADMDAHTQTHL